MIHNNMFVSSDGDDDDDDDDFLLSKATHVMLHANEGRSLPSC